MKERSSLALNRLLNYACLFALFATLLSFSRARQVQGAYVEHPYLHKETRLSFFTNTASHLLASQLKMDFGRIQLYPTNEYTPAVHRLLQVAANLCDASSDHEAADYPYLPSVFRPILLNDNGVIYISGYSEVAETNVLGAKMRDLNDPSDRAALSQQEMIYGVPLIVGASKGLPNFNQLSMATSVSVTRKLQFIAPAVRDPKITRPTSTNQMYEVAISNVFGIEAWNSYSNSYPRPLEVIVTTEMAAVVTNELGKVLLTNRFVFQTNQIVNSWDGFKDLNYAADSFKIPFAPETSHFLFLTNSSYAQAIDSFVPLTGLFERDQSPPFAVPHWWLQLYIRLRFAIVDIGVDPPRIVDYVNLASLENPIDITFELMRDANCGPAYNPPRNAAVPNGLFWCTNRAAPLDPTFGMRLQMDVSAGIFNADWTHSATMFPRIGLADQAAAIDFFRTNFFGLPARYGSRSGYLTNVFYSPYNPLRTLYTTTSWSANDPLVHYTLNDLEYLPYGANRVSADDLLSQTQIANIGHVNDRYEPWGAISPTRPYSLTSVEIAVKDPLIWCSDAWDFPHEAPLSVTSFGKIHRGTPWQTIYMKSSGVSPEIWARWVGTVDLTEAQKTNPTNDWRMVSCLISLLGREHPQKLVSVNEASFSDWQSVLKGLTVLTNISTNASVFRTPEFVSLVMNKKSTQMETIIADIYATRAKQPFQIWGDRGDVLATPSLSINSPWLNKSIQNQLWGISDEAYEIIPSQILQRLRTDSIGTTLHARHPGKGVKFTGIVGYDYIVEESADLLHWNPVSTNHCRDGSIEILEMPPPAGENRFYRTRLVAPN